MSESKILVGYEAEAAEEARVPVFHLICTGITQHGKTEELKRLTTEVQRQGYTVLIIDVKDKPEGDKGDFEGFGVEVPIYLAGIADVLSIYGLLESHSGLPLRRELPELARACKRGKTLRGAYEILKQLLSEEKIHPVRRDRIEVLMLVLEGLIGEMDKAKPSSKLQLKKGQINVMNLRGWSNGFKQLAVNDATAYIRKHYRKIIEVFDEAHQQIPQGYGSGSKKTVTSAIKEGAGSQQYIWVADQTIKEVDKDVIAQIPLKIYGGQPGAKLRAKETLDHLPVKTWRDQRINEEFIMRLQRGFFLVGERDQTRLVYALPIWMPGPLGRLVAEGKCSPEAAKEICDLLLRLPLAEERVEIAKPTKFVIDEKREKKFQEEVGKWKGEVDEWKRKAEEAWQKAEDLAVERDEWKGKWKETSDLAKGLNDGVTKLEGELAARRDELAEAQGSLKDFEELRTILGRILPTGKMLKPRVQVHPGLNEAGAIALIDERLTDRLLEKEDIRVVQVDVDDRIKELVKEDLVSQAIDRIKSLPEPAKRAARYIHGKQTVSVGDLYYYLYEKAGRPPGAFYNNVINPLVAANLIRKDKKTVIWSIDDLLLSRFKDFIETEEIDSMRKYLLSFIL